MVQFSSRMDLLKGSEIRELLKLTAQPDIISFAGGMPAPELFPVEQMMEASIAVLKENGRVALQYSSTEGYPRLREQIAERMLAKNNIHTDKDHILVTSGSQQGLDFSGRVFLNPGDVVLLESPSYLGAVNAFKACEPKFIVRAGEDPGHHRACEDDLRHPRFPEPHRPYLGSGSPSSVHGHRQQVRDPRHRG